jgi:hypothetical protein
VCAHFHFKYQGAAAGVPEKVLSAIASCEAACSGQSDNACILASFAGLPVGKKLLELGRTAATGRRSALAYLDTLDVQVSRMTDVFATDKTDALLESGEFLCSSQGVVAKLVTAMQTVSSSIVLFSERHKSAFVCWSC